MKRAIILTGPRAGTGTILELARFAGVSTWLAPTPMSALTSLPRPGLLPEVQLVIGPFVYAQALHGLFDIVGAVFRNPSARAWSVHEAHGGSGVERALHWTSQQFPQEWAVGALDWRGIIHGVEIERAAIAQTRAFEWSVIGLLHALGANYRLPDESVWLDARTDRRPIPQALARVWAERSCRERALVNLASQAFNLEP